MHVKRNLLILFCSLVGLGQPLVWGQATTSLSGAVTDNQNGVISGAKVTLKLMSTGAIRVETTNENGQYRFAQIVPGQYELDVESKGFAVSKNMNIDLVVDQPGTYNVALSVATAVAEVTVNANTTQLLDTETATLGNTLSAEQVEDLPVASRNTNLLLTLQPGVIYLGSGSGASPNDTRSGAVNGGRSDQNNITLDGVDVNDVNNGFGIVPVLRITQDTVAEIRVTTNNPTADQGRAGAQSALVTRSGSNDFHGTLYEYNKSNIWEANDFFIKQTDSESNLPNRPPKLNYNVFGGSATGSIKKNSVFYFGNYEGQRFKQGQSESAVVPTASFRSGDLAYVCSKTTQCSETNPYIPGVTLNTLTPTQVLQMDPQNLGENAAVLSVMQKLPLPNNPREGDSINFEGYDFVSDFIQNLNDYTVRLDWNISNDGKHTAFFRGTLQDDTQSEPPTYPGLPASQRRISLNKGFSGGYTFVPTNRLVNNLTFGLTRESETTAGQIGTPYISFYFTLPQALTTTSSFVVPVYNLVDNLSWTLHGHSFEFGTNIRFISDAESSNATAFAHASGSPQGFANGIAGSGGAFDPGAYGFPAVGNKAYAGYAPYNDAILAVAGILSNATVTYNATKTGAPLPQNAPLVYDYRWNEYEFYGQDSWKVSKNFTVTYGLRYTYQQVPAETSGAQVGVCQAVGTACAPDHFSLTQFLNASSALASSGQAANGAGELGFPLNGRYNHQPDYWTPDKRDFAPRIAVAFSPMPESGIFKSIFGYGKSSIRAGYSMVYNHFGAGIVNTFASTGSYGLSTTYTTNSGTYNPGNAPRLTSITSVPSVLIPPAPAVTFPGIAPSTGPTSAAIYWSEDAAIKSPYMEMVDFSIARQLRSGALIEVSYIGNFGHRLLEQEDVAMPTNLAAAGTNYFAAARQLSSLAYAGTPISSVPANPYWETLFAPLIGKNIGYGTGNTATQNVYGMINANLGNETQVLYNLDLPNTITNAGLNSTKAYPSYRFYHDQFSALYAWRSVGNSNYNALQAVYHQQFSYGLRADVNYSFSKSLDLTSQAERESDSGSNNFAQIINTWAPNQLYGVSDFDVRHQITSDWIWDLPIGRGKQYFTSTARGIDELIGGWQVTGIVRWTSGLPFGVVNGNSFYPTNWDIAGFATLRSAPPKTKDGSQPGGMLQQVFANPTTAFESFAHALPGDSGSRNPMRGDGFFELDTGLGKSFAIVDRTRVKLGVEIFNVTNSVRFDARTISDSLQNQNNFGIANQELSTARQAQLYGRIIF